MEPSQRLAEMARRIRREGELLDELVTLKRELLALAEPPSIGLPVRVGLHDLAGASWMKVQGRRGVALAHVTVQDEPLALDFSEFEAAGIDILLRIGYGYADGTGTLPPPDRLAYFESAVITTLLNVRGVLAIQYGNEINNPSEWPDGFPLTLAYYVQSYNRIWNSLPLRVHLGPAALDPYYGPGSDNRMWWIGLLETIHGADALFLHAKTQSNDPAEVDSPARFADEPLRWQYLHLRTFETALSAVPERFQTKPVYLSEVNPQRLFAGQDLFGWRADNVEWIRRAKQAVARWNEVGQAIYGMIFYRWADDAWALENSPQLLQAIFQDSPDGQGA